MKKDINIQIIRIVAMFFILFCHFFNEIGNKLAVLGQFFNVGVFIFFIISAYLYGKKNITNSLKWIKRRVVQICVPVYIWLIFVNVIYLITRTDVKYINNLFYVLNIQAFVNYSLQGLEHLWFISIILIIYLITIILNKLKNVKISLNNVYMILLFQIVSYVFVSLYFLRWTTKNNTRIFSDVSNSNSICVFIVCGFWNYIKEYNRKDK